MTSRATVFVVGALFLAGPVSSQQSVETAIFPDTEYISGKAGFGQKIKGQLIVQESGLDFRTKEGRSVFTLPITTIQSASNVVETDPGSFGRKMALGIFASKREEFVTVKTETPEGAEAIVFKCKKKTSDSIVTKIDFQRKKAQAPAQAAEPAASPAPTPAPQ